MDHISVIIKNVMDLRRIIYMNIPDIKNDVHSITLANKILNENNKDIEQSISYVKSNSYDVKQIYFKIIKDYIEKSHIKKIIYSQNENDTNEQEEFELNKYHAIN